MRHDPSLRAPSAHRFGIRAELYSAIIIKRTRSPYTFPYLATVWTLTFWRQSVRTKVIDTFVRFSLLKDARMSKTLS